jgi:NADPH-dependent 2,4-dienoyl-CoA reductase/sulfur reductase-like enzyme
MEKQEMIKLINYTVDVAVIGGGPAGLAAAISAYEHGAKNIIILDRNDWFGGILPQCIHDGFGVEEKGTSMTGPEYAELYIEIAKKIGIKMIKETMVIQFNKQLKILAVNKKGLHNINAKSIILATGCREKTRWNSMIPGDRPSGIFTAGVAQALINLYNILPGKNVIILGSGDVGLIIARRLKFEGANILGIIEILPYITGLPRNLVQCIEDYNIPVFLNHTIKCIKGKERLEHVIINEVDGKFKSISGTERKIECDTLLLSLGMIPENELARNVGIKIDKNTNGPLVTQDFETTLSGVFACGNCVHIYDTVDILSYDAKIAGKSAAISIFKKRKLNKIIGKIIAGKGIKYVVPQLITNIGEINLKLRVEKQIETCMICVISNDNEILKKKLYWVSPSNMIEVKINISSEETISKKKLEVILDEL